MSLKMTDAQIRANIIEFRKRYARSSDQIKSLVEKTKEAYSFSLNSPTQILRIRLKKPLLECLVILHKKKSPDMKIVTIKDIALEELSTKLLESSASELIDSTEARKIPPAIKREIGSVKRELGSELEEALISTTTLSDDLAIFIFNLKLVKDTLFLARSLDLSMRDQLRDSLIEKQRESINQTLKELIRDAGKVQAPESKTKILETTEKLQGQIEDVYKQQKELREDVSGLRRIVGGKTFGEWKVFISEIDKINTRIDALSDIRSAYDKVLAQQNDFMKQQTEVIKQQASFVTWIKYATILVPVAVLLTPVISALIQYFLGAS